MRTSHRDQQADLVVAADGIRSTLRTALFPATAGPRYAGYTAWRMITGDPGGTEPAETWGPAGGRELLWRMLVPRQRVNLENARLRESLHHPRRAPSWQQF